MTPNQKKVAAGLAVGFLLAAVACTVWLWSTASPSGVVDDPAAAVPDLRTGWKAALWLIELGTATKTIFAVLITVITACVGAAGELYKHKWQIALIAIACLAGTVFSSLTMVALRDTEVLDTLAYYSTIQTNAELRSAANVFFIALIGWFAGFLALQLGVKSLPEEMVAKAVRRLTGQQGERP